MSRETRKVAVVTGGSRGIGRGVAERLAQDGYDLLLVASDAERLSATKGEISKMAGVRVEAAAVDLRGFDSGKLVLAMARRSFERVDVLVNSAGATKGGSHLAVDEPEWQDGFALKFFGAVRMCKAFWPELVATKGSIVNIIGGFTRTPSSEFVIAGAVNAALANFSKALAGQGIRDDVNVNAIHPGTTETDRLRDIVATRARAENLPEADIRTNLAEREKTRRIGTPADVSALVSFLCRPEARHIHGVAIAVDGGATRSVF